jgi:hypothetical protein
VSFSVGGTGGTLVTTAATSGTTKTVGSIVGARRVTIIGKDISTDGTSELMIQIGDSGGIETTGYDGNVRNSGSTSLTITTGFVLLNNGKAADAWSFYFQMTLMDATLAIWGAHWQSTNGDTGGADDQAWGIGNKQITTALTQVRLTTVGTPDDFDGTGSFGVFWEA